MHMREPNRFSHVLNNIIGGKCMSKIRKDITGQRFGRLVALRPDYNDIRYWYFKCDCGKETRKNRNCVVMGSTKSCGCLKEQINKINLNREKIIISPGMK